MKRLPLFSKLVTCCFMGIMLSLLSQVSAEEPKISVSVPKIVFDKLDHDFGKQVSGPLLETTFIFKNKGNAPLFIEKVKAG